MGDDSLASKDGRNIRQTLRLMKKHRLIYLMMVPVILYFIVFSYYPLLLGLVQSFQTNSLLGTPGFAGIQNYTQLFSDFQFRQAFVNSFVIGLFTQICTFFASLVFALGLNEVRQNFLRSSVQTISYLPNLFSWAVVGGMWITLLSNTGLINGILNAFGLKSVQFMAMPGLAKLIMVLTEAWKSTGYCALLFMASIVSINGSIYEAAQIDGASRLKQIVRLTIPELVPTMKVIVLLGAMGLFQNFDQIFVMENSTILDNIRTLLYYIYVNGILQFKVGLATAGATVVLLATFLLTAVVRRLLRYDETYQGD